MERKIGDTFEFEGKKIEVKAASSNECDGCILDGKCTRNNIAIVGTCGHRDRTDGTDVIFVEVQEQPHEEDEQPQDEQPQKINLCEILKHCPQGETFWSPMLNGVKFSCIDDERQMIIVETIEGHFTWEINHDGTISIDEVTSPEVMLFPSKEQRDWNKVKYEKKKELPKTWEEFCEQNEITKMEYFIDESSSVRKAKIDGGIRHKEYDRNVMPSREAAEAHLALMQLHQLRDAWREGWLPDWTDDTQNKYAIVSLDGEFSIRIRYTNRHFLAFQNEERADEFHACFIDLIRKAGDLI